jgi:hypothetical protein
MTKALFPLLVAAGEQEGFFEDSSPPRFLRSIFTLSGGAIRIFRLRGKRQKGEFTDFTLYSEGPLKCEHPTKVLLPACCYHEVSLCKFRGYDPVAYYQQSAPVKGSSQFSFQ